MIVEKCRIFIVPPSQPSRRKVAWPTRVSHMSRKCSSCGGYGHNSRSCLVNTDGLVMPKPNSDIAPESAHQQRQQTLLGVKRSHSSGDDSEAFDSGTDASAPQGNHEQRQRKRGERVTYFFESLPARAQPPVDEFTAKLCVCRQSVERGGAPEFSGRPQKARQGVPHALSLFSVLGLYVCAACVVMKRVASYALQYEVEACVEPVCYACRATGEASRGTLCRPERRRRLLATRRSTSYANRICTTGSDVLRCLTWRRSRKR